jgi:hypothetical protein
VPADLLLTQTVHYATLEQNQNSRAQAKDLQCGFFLGKKPRKGLAIGCSYSGSAVAAPAVMSLDLSNKSGLMW